MLQHDLLKRGTYYKNKGEQIMRFDGPQNIMKAQPRLQIREGMSVEDVRKNGSEGQKLAASLFDTDGAHRDAQGNWVKDGIFNKSEAEYFNQFNFSVKNNIFTMYNRKSGHTTEIKYNNIEDLKKVLNSSLNEPTYINFFSENGKQKLYSGSVGLTDGKTTIDLTNRTVEVNGVTHGSIYTNGNKTIVKNSSLEVISSSSKELEIENTMNKGILWDSNTAVDIDKSTNLKVDNNSKVDIERKE